MTPLTVNDLLPLEEYASRRREFFDGHRRYIDRCRRVRIGSRLTLIFENRQTLWYRVQEIVRIARLAEPGEVQLELNLYNRLLPSRERLQAALLIEIQEETQLVKELSPWRDIQGEFLRLVLGRRAYPAHLVTCRPEDRSIGTAHWVQFHLDEQAAGLLADLEQPAYFHFDNGAYQQQSDALSEDLRLSLVDDLRLSEREDVKVAA